MDLIDMAHSQAMPVSGPAWEVAPGVLLRDVWRRNGAGGEDRDGQVVEVPAIGWRRHIRWGRTVDLWPALAACQTADEATSTYYRWLAGTWPLRPDTMAGAPDWRDVREEAPPCPPSA